MQKFVTAQNMEIYFEGAPIRLRGLGVGTWLNMEHFMLGIPTPDSMIRETFNEIYGAGVSSNFFEKFEKNFFTQEDVDLIKSCGINFLRVPINYRLFIDDNDTDNYREYGFKLLKRLLDLCEKNEIFVMPDLHTAPGGQNPDWHSDNRTGYPQFWEFEVFRKQIVGLWAEIAKRCASYRYLLGYDILNEPAMASADAMNSFYREVTAAIREKDKNHPIVLEGDLFAMDFSSLEVPNDSNIILSFHYYPTVWHPNLLEKDYGREKRISEMEEGLLKIARIREDLSLPVICGEAGYELDKTDIEFSLMLLEDTLALFEKHNLSYAVWAYKDADFMGMVYPDRESKWMKLATDIRKKWSHDEEMIRANRLIEQIGEEFGGLDSSLVYKLQFRLRGIMYEMEREKILKPILKNISPEDIISYPDSWIFENCRVHEDYAKLIMQFTGKGE